ncbi:MAG TPA: DUF58 domain-containing protein [Steroidobacteraceae bacterium]|nr:DUF58 domain-containing protein [Steroidobacteraceae bacterium]
MDLRAAAIRRIRAWAARRHGGDLLPATVDRRRIYILPTRFGLTFAGLLATMLIAALNYNSNLALAFAFFMVSLALVAMHHCHRNLSGLSVDVNLEADAFAGGDAVFCFLLRNDSALERSAIEVRLDPAVRSAAGVRAVKSVPAQSYERLMLPVRVGARGVARWDQLEIRTRHPFGWFRAWTYVYVGLAAYIAPEPRGDRRLPDAAAGSGRALRSAGGGDEDFAGLRAYAPGVPLKHMAWKVLARGGEAAVRMYTDLGAQPEYLEWSALPGLEVEARLSQLCRWVLACESGSPRPYGLRIPGIEIPPGRGATHRARCLRALAAHSGAGSP